MVSNWLVPERMMPAANAPMMSADPASAASAERPSANAIGEHQEHVAHPHPDHHVEQARHEEASDQHRDHQEPDRHRQRPQDAQHRDGGAGGHAGDDAQDDEPEHVVDDRRADDDAGLGVAMRPRSESTRAVIPTEVAVSVAPTKMAAVVRSASPLAGCGR